MSFLGKLHVVDLEGTPRARGQQHGEALRGVIEEHHRRWCAALDEALGADPAPYLDALLAETRFLQVAEAEVPELVEELRGIAEGWACPSRGFLRARCLMRSRGFAWSTLPRAMRWARAVHRSARMRTARGEC
jgi:hypothetical protein